MQIIPAFAALAMLFEPSGGVGPSAQPWSIAVAGNMAGGGPVFDEMHNAWAINGNSFWGQITITAVEIRVTISARGCLEGATDYRQEVTLPKGDSADRETEAVRRQALMMVEILQKQCSLPIGSTADFMSGLETTYRALWAKAAGATRRR